MNTKRKRLLYSAVVVVVFYYLFNLQDVLVKFPTYRHLYRQHPFYGPEGLKTSLEILLCLAAVAFFLGKDYKQTFAELKLDRGLKKGLLFGFLATVPFGIGLALTHRLGKLAWPNIFYLAFFAPFAEELVVRAYGFGQLYRRCRWPLWLAMLVTAVVFGRGHVEQGSNFRKAAALFLLLSTGGVFFAWFYYRWDSIWFPWTVHALMNFYWELFSVSRTALGGWFPVALQWTTILTATFVTWKATRKPSPMQISV